MSYKMKDNYIYYIVYLYHSDGTGGRSFFSNKEDARAYYDRLKNEYPDNEITQEIMKTTVPLAGKENDHNGF